MLKALFNTHLLTFLLTQLDSWLKLKYKNGKLWFYVEK